MRMIMVLLLSMALACVAIGQPVRNGDLPGPLPLFPSDSWWNVDISEAPVDPASATFIAFIGSDRGMHPDFGGDSGEEHPLIYGLPYIVVEGTQLLEQVSFFYADESDYGAAGRPPGYPIPLEARSGRRWIEGGRPGDESDAEGDRHMLIVDRDHRILFELFDVDWSDESKQWSAGSGAIFPLDSNLRRPEGWTSADAAGLAILPGLVRYDEVSGSGPIRHAFRVTVRRTNGHVYPASHTAGTTAGALPMGARLRLRESVDIAGYSAPLRKIFQAMKTHGLIVADNGSDLYVTGTYDTRWDNDVLNPAFRSITASDFEVIELGWKPFSAPPCSKPVITMHPLSMSIRSGGSANLSVAASGAQPLEFQWYEGSSGDSSSPIDNASSAVLTVSPVVTSRYWVAVSNPCGIASSDAALITVDPSRRRPVRRPS